MCAKVDAPWRIHSKRTSSTVTATAASVWLPSWRLARSGRASRWYRDVGDFDLWVRFFRHARLYSVDALIGGYRFHSDSLSASDLDRYNQRCDKIIESELKSIPQAGAVKIFRRVTSAFKNVPKVRGLWQRLALKSLYQFAGPDWPPVVEDQENKWVIREGMRRIRSVPR